MKVGYLIPYGVQGKCEHSEHSVGYDACPYHGFNVKVGALTPDLKRDEAHGLGGEPAAETKVWNMRIASVEWDAWPHTIKVWKSVGG